MLYVPGELVRRAATGVSSAVVSVSSTVTNTVSSGVSTVASVATGSRRRSMDRNSQYQDMDQMLINAKDKYTLNLKCTPSKDAQTMANLAIRSGFLRKRNEQGVYHNKFLCIVPHSFLYYFDTETSDSPRGVIDLELYTNVTRDDNTLKMSTNDDDKLRAFFFEDEDHHNLDSWSTCMTRDRYQNVCDERNAYQQMQIDMTGVLDNASLLRKSSEVEKNTLEIELEQTTKNYAESMNILRSMLVVVGITEEEMMKLSDVNKIGHALKKAIVELKAGMEKKYDESLEIIEQMSQSHQTVVEELQDRLRIEGQIRKDLELNILSERKECEARLAQAAGEVDNAMMNFQIAVASRTEAEQKSATLSEQKKVLIKEVKQQRKKLDEINEAMELLKGLNEKLVTATAELQEQLNAANSALAVNAELQAKDNERVAALLAENAAALGALPTGHEGSGEETSQQQQSPGHGAGTGSMSSFSKLTNKLFHHGGGGGDDRGSAHGGSQDNDNDHHARLNSDHSAGSGGASSSSTAGQSDETRMNWEASPSHLKDLGWLSPEQNKLVDRRMSETVHHDETVPVAAAAKPAHRSSMYMFSSAMSMMSGGGSGSGSGHGSNEAGIAAGTPEHPTTAAASSGTAATAVPKESRRSSLGMMASMFTSSLAGVTSTSGSGRPPTGAPSSAAPAGALSSELLDAEPYVKDSGAASASSSSAFSSLIEDDPERLPSAMRLRCLRCEGSVEGPKYSTCKCSIPALTPDDLNGGGGGGGVGSSSISMFTGFMSKGAGGLMKAGTAAMTYSTGGSSVSTSSSSSHGMVMGSPSVLGGTGGVVNGGGGKGGGALDEDLANSVTSESSDQLPRQSFNSLLDSE